MKYTQLLNVLYILNSIRGNSEEEKAIKKIRKIAEKLKPYQEEYSTKYQDLRLDNAATDKDGVLIVNEKGEFKFTKEGIKKLETQLKELGEKEFEFKKIEVVNPEGLQNFTFLEDWVSGVTFVKEEEEEL